MSIIKNEDRPWGWFRTFLNESTYAVKLLHIYPKSRLSYQSHQFRSELWVVVKGEPAVILNGQEIQLYPEQSLIIPVGWKHRIENRTNSDVEIIETQYGEKCNEDDIVRYEDDYNRVAKSATTSTTNYPPMSREDLLEMGFCCECGCLNCPYS